MDKVLDIAKTISILKIRLPNGELNTQTLYTTSQKEIIKPLIELKWQIGWHICQNQDYKPVLWNDGYSNLKNKKY